MKILDLPHGHQAMIDEEDWPRVCDLTLYLGQNGYVYYSVWRDGKSTPHTLHARLMPAPKGLHVDHIDGDSLNNTRSNLRLVTPSVNQANRRKLNRNNSSGVRGVQLMRWGKWRAQIMANGRGLHLGMFETREQAIAARKAAELEHFGELCP